MEKINIFEKQEKEKPIIKFTLDKENDKKEFLNFYNKYKQYDDLVVLPELQNQLKNIDTSETRKVVEAYIDQVYIDRKVDIEQGLEQAMKKWGEVEVHFYEMVEKIFKDYKWPEGDYLAIGSILDRYPRDIAAKKFTFPVIRDDKDSNVVIAHEMLHFITYDYLENIYDLKSIENVKDDNRELSSTKSAEDEVRLWQFTENLNTLIENGDDWQVITQGEESFPKYECRGLYLEMEKIWKGNDDVDDLIRKTFEIGS